MRHRKCARPIIRERAVWFRRLDRFAVSADTLAQVLGRNQQREREQAEAKLAGEYMRILAGTRYPHRRMRFLNRHRYDGPFGNIEIVAPV
jgi:hypothetical protein